MSTRQRTAEVIEIGSDRLEEAAGLLARAFHDYPMVRFFFSDAGEAYPGRLRSLFRLAGMERLAQGWPMPGVLIDGELVAAACLTGTEEKPDPPELAAAEAQFAASVSERTLERFSRYTEAKKAHVPKEEHLYLACIGTAPEAQGRGYGRLLLERAVDLSRRDGRSRGVALDTQSADNVSLYAHFGYRVTGESRIDDVPMWFMFRPDDPPP